MNSLVSSGHHAAPPLRTLVLVELRKNVDTRAGRAVLGTMTGIAALVLLLVAVASEDTAPLGELLEPVVLPLTALMPVIGVLTFTSEWSQRAAMSTFALVPRRQRVLLAKTIAVFVLDVLVVMSVTALGLLAHLLHVWKTGGEFSYEGTSATLGLLSGIVLVVTTTGVATGLLLHSTPLAITAVFLIPTVASSLLGAISVVGPYLSGASWSDWLVGALSGQGATVPAPAVATSALLWLVVPAGVGTYRHLTREVR